MIDGSDKKTEYADGCDDPRHDVMETQYIAGVSEAADEEAKADKWACCCLASRAAAHP